MELDQLLETIALGVLFVSPFLIGDRVSFLFPLSGKATG